MKGSTLDKINFTVHIRIHHGLSISLRVTFNYENVHLIGSPTAFDLSVSVSTHPIQCNCCRYIARLCGGSMDSISLTAKVCLQRIN